MLHVTIEERRYGKGPWHAQFSYYPDGYFRGVGPTPAAALRSAWRQFERESWRPRGGPRGRIRAPDVTKTHQTAPKECKLPIPGFPPCPYSGPPAQDGL